MAKKGKKRRWQEKMWIVISIISILAMVLFTALPFLSSVPAAGY